MRNILPGLRRRFLVLALVFGLVAEGADGATQATTSYAVAAVTGSVTLKFTGGPSAERAAGTVTVTFSRNWKGSTGGRGTLTERGGSVRFPVASRISERVMLRVRAGPSSPYVEQQCRVARSSRTTGGLALRRLPRNRVRVGWNLPHARAGTCPGPRRVNLESRMAAVVPAARFAGARVTLKLAGSARFAAQGYRGTYRWRGTVTLVRR